MRFRSFAFDAGTRRLMQGNRPVHLTPKAFDLLDLLIGAAPRVALKEEIHRTLWAEQAVSDATLVGLIKEIRRALGDSDAKRRIIRTVHRVGYAFDAAIEADEVTVTSNCLLVINGRRTDLLEGDNIVGRDPACNVWIDEATVSRRHARIVVDAEHAALEDLGSKNGTCVGDQALAAVAELRDGDRIRFGHVLALFFVSPSDRPTRTQLTVSD